MKGELSQIAGLILAAGYSSRMADFKPLLPLGGSTAIERAVGSLRDAGIRDVRVVTGWRAEALTPTLYRLGVRVVPNPDYARGMYSSVMAGVRTLGPEVGAFFLLPVDHPLVKHRTIERLIRAFQENEAEVVHPTFLGKRGHPPLISVGCLAGAPSCDPPGGLRSLLSRWEDSALNVEMADQAVHMDMDTPADYERLLAYCSREEVPTAAECEAILLMLKVPPRVVAHGRAVAAVAAELASRLHLKGLSLDRELVQAAALLHDLARTQPDHARAGAEALVRLGYPGVASCVASHMELETGSESRLAEPQLLYLADRLVQEDRVVSLEGRLGTLSHRFAGSPEALEAATRRLRQAETIQRQVEAILGSPLEEIFPSVSSGGAA